MAEATVRKARKPRSEPVNYAGGKPRIFQIVADFDAYMAAYPDTSGLLAYYYRLEPKIDLSLIGLPGSSILKTARVDEMTEAFAAAKWGRGKYMLKVTDSNRPRGEQESCRVFFKIDDPDLISVYDPRSLLVNDPDNADEVARLLQRGVMVRDAVTGAARVKTEYAVPAAVATTPPESEPVISQRFLTDMMLRVMDRAVQPPVSPKEQFAEIIEAARMLHPAGPAAPVAVNAEVAELRAELAVIRRSQVPAADPVESSFDAYLRMQNFLRENTPAVSAIPAPVAAFNWVKEIVTGLQQLGQTFLPVLAPLANHYFGPARVAGASGPAPGPGAGAPAVMPGSGAPAASAEGYSVVVPPPRALDLTGGDMWGNLNAVAALALERMAAGMTGYDFAAFLCSSYTPGGVDIFRMLREDGTPGVMGLLGSHPLVASAPEGRRRALESWLDHFFQFDPGGGAVEESQEAA